MKPLLLQAFEGTNKTVPVWFMRQAGRFLPQYREIKDKYSLNEMFRTPDIAAQVTCLPVEILNVDAAILFADILTLPSAMGFHIDFTSGNGPMIKDAISSSRRIDEMHDFEDLSYVGETIRIAVKNLTKDV